VDLLGVSVKQTMSIGTFSRLTGLTPKALRIYERRGLLRPARVGPDNGYRYYEVKQLRQAEIVRLLRTLGLPIAHICDVLESASPEELDSVLAVEKRRLEHQMRQLAVFHDLLERMGALRAMADQDPSADLVELPATAGLSVELVVARDHFDRRYWTAVDELREKARSNGLRQSAPEIVILPSNRIEEAAMEPNPHLMLHAEVFLPVHAPTKLRSALGISVLPACFAARSIFRGLYWERYRLAYASQLEWLLTSPFTLGGPIRERYICGSRDSADPGCHETELVWPLALANATHDAEPADAGF
jgi:DNA-binding transcriptional MerR regulator